MDNLGILIQAILSLKDTTDSKNQIAKELPKLESQLQFDKNTRVKIVAGLDVGKSKSLIQSQLNTLANQAKAPTIKVGIDTSGIGTTQNITNNLKNVQTQAQQTASAINNNTAILESFKQSLRNIGMDSTDIESVANRINGLNVQIESLNQSMSTANGKRGQKNILSVEISGIDKMGQAVKLTQQFNADTGALIKTIDNVSTATQKENSQLENLMAQQIKRRADLKNQVEQISKSALDLNASRTITNDTHRTDIETKTKQINEAIEKMGSTSKTVFAEQDANISNLISELKIMVSEYQRAENVSTTLKPDKLASAISKAESKATSLLEDVKSAKNAGVTQSDKLIENLNVINSFLDRSKNKEVINKADVEQAYTALSNAKNELDALVKIKTSGSSVEKVKIQAETLSNELDDFANNNKGFDTFSATINRTIVNVESLKESLKNVNSTSGLSVIKAQADALKSSFKSSTADTKEYVGQIKETISNIEALQKSTVFNRNSSNTRVSQIKNEMAQFLTQYQGLLSKLNENITPEGFESVKKELVELNAKFKLSYGSAIQFETELKNDNGAEKFAQRVSILSTQIKEYQKINSKSLKKFGSEFDSMLSELNNPNIDHQSYEKIRSQFQLIKREINATGLAGKTFFERMKEQAAKFSSWMSLTGVVTSLWHDLKQMVTNVIELDSAMTNLKKVTDETETVYSRFLKNTSQQAKELHATMTDLVEQTATWAKLGFSLQEAESLAKISMIYSKVGEVDNTTSVSDLVTAMKAFNIESSKSITIVDALNELGNNFATDAASLGEGLTKSASALSAANNSFEQSVALLTGGTEITQNANEMGSALKVISMRIRGMKGELQALGEEYEDIESISKIQTQILNLSNGKVNIFDDNGNFQATYDILKDISEIYDSLSDPDKADLTEILFGKMRGNQGIALIQAFQSGQIEKAYEAAKNSAGSAQEEFDRWSQSIEAHIETFKASFESLSQTIVDSDPIKFVVDFGTTTLNTLDSVISKFGTIPTLLGGTAIFGAFKNVGSPKMFGLVLICQQ